MDLTFYSSSIDLGFFSWFSILAFALGFCSRFFPMDFSRLGRMYRKALGVSRTTVQARIERLERHKIIAGYSVVLGAGFQKEMIESHILINCSPKAAPALERRLGEMDSIIPMAAQRCLRCRSMLIKWTNNGTATNKKPVSSAG